MGEVHDDVGLRGGELRLVLDIAEERLAVGLADPRALEDPSDVVVGHPSEVLAEEEVLDLPLGRLPHVQRVLVEELDVADAHVEWRDPDVHTPGRAEVARVKAVDRERRLREVRDVDAGAHDAAHQRALQHPARAVLVAVERHDAPERERGGIGRSEPRSELGREVDVHETGDAEAAEQRAPALRPPDEARPDDGPTFDLLVRPDLHLRAHPRALVHDGVVADDAAFLEDDARFQRALATDDRAVELGALADVGVPPDDRTVDDRAGIDDDLIAKDRRADDLRAAGDLHALPEVDGAEEERARIHLDVTAGEDAGLDLGADRADRDAPAEDVRVGARVLADRAHVGPIALGDVAVEGLALREELREEVPAEVEARPDRVAPEDARLDDVDAGIDGVREDLAPGRLLEELRDAAALVRDDDAVLERVGHAVERERDRRALRLVERDHLREVDVGERVAGDDEERVTERVADLAHRAAGAERRLLDAVAEPEAHAAAIAVGVLDHGGEVLEGHVRLGDAAAREQVEDVPEAGLIDDGDHRLRAVDGERSEPTPLAPGHDDGEHGELVAGHGCPAPISVARHYASPMAKIDSRSCRE